jgi:hypothetical protein
MLFIFDFIKKFNNYHKNKINLLVKKLIIEYKIKDSNIIYIIDSYDKKSINITKDIQIINDGRKKLILEINKINDKEFGICEILLKNLVKNLLEKKLIEKNNIKFIIDIYNEESINITNNNNLIKHYKNVLISKLNE